MRPLVLLLAFALSACGSGEDPKPGVVTMSKAETLAALKDPANWSFRQNATVWEESFGPESLTVTNGQELEWKIKTDILANSIYYSAFMSGPIAGAIDLKFRPDRQWQASRDNGDYVLKLRDNKTNAMQTIFTMKITVQ